MNPFLNPRTTRRDVKQASSECPPMFWVRRSEKLSRGETEMEATRDLRASSMARRRPLKRTIYHTRHGRVVYVPCTSLQQRLCLLTYFVTVAFRRHAISEEHIDRYPGRRSDYVARLISLFPPSNHDPGDQISTRRSKQSLLCNTMTFGLIHNRRVVTTDNQLC